MCGIAGIAVSDSRRYASALDSMVNALQHRGPDGSATKFYVNCGLGHTRLTIIDLTTGDQPMLSADGRVAVTFNGEIYGYRELKKVLSDYEFKTTSDTEVILALYERYGTDFVKRLPGMFALAIWDDRTQSLFVARDRFGEKPFYYAYGRNNEFLFASEIKSLLASNLFRPELSEESLKHYLTRLYVHPHKTIYSNVFVLPPAHSLLVRGGAPVVQQYWSMPETQEPVSNEDAVSEFQRLFERAVENQLIADVPVGAFLSGGLDSSSVVAAASRNHPRLRTLSVGFGDAINELPYARGIAERYRTDHLELQADDENIGELMTVMADVYDEPFADSSCIPTYVISREARLHNKVVLTGDGGDELLGGYDFWYRPLRNMQQTNPKLAAVAGVLRHAAGVSYRLGMPMFRDVAQGADLRKQFRSVAEAHASQGVFFSDAEVAELLFNTGTNGRGNGHSRLVSDSIDAAMRMDLCDYMPGDILVKTDRASMAHGLELRAPFLDVDFASFCISLPDRLKVTDTEDKWILRQSYNSSWTEAVRRRGKAGFGAPVGEWLKRPDVARLKTRIFENRSHPLFNLLAFEPTRRFVAKDNYQTWILLTLGLWLERAGEQCL